MLFGNAQLYEEVRDAKLGRIALPPALAQLRDWVAEQYSVSVVHIAFDAIDIGPCAGRPRLNLILETDADYDALSKDALTIRPDVKRRVLKRFAKIAATSEPNRYNTTDVHLILDNFSDECLGRACSAFLREHKAQVMDAFPDANIWDIAGFSRSIVVFLQTTNDVRQKQDDGTCDRIVKRCLDLTKPFDEFGYLTNETFRLTFDSKTNLDENYKGNLFYYFR